MTLSYTWDGSLPTARRSRARSRARSRGPTTTTSTWPRRRSPARRELHLRQRPAADRRRRAGRHAEPDDRLRDRDHPRQRDDARTYSGFGELATTSATAGATALYATTYTRDGLGRIVQLDETIQGETSSTLFDYDTAGRLWKVTVDGVLTAEYRYDANGNRTAVTNDLGLTTTATYDAQDRLLTYGAASYTYTKNGELASKTDASGRHARTPTTCSATCGPWSCPTARPSST